MTFYCKMQNSQFRIDRKMKQDKKYNCIIYLLIVLQAIKDMDVKLLIIGDGPNLQKLVDFIKNEKISEKVEIIKSVAWL